MARSQKVDGTCCICGEYTRLTFEHIPPHSAFNDRPVLVSDFEAVINSDPGEMPSKYRINQRGSGGYTLCDSCNNKTGDWYAKHYAFWCYQAMELLLRTRGRPTLLVPFTLFPLAVFKQVMAMFCSINGSGFAERNPGLVDFLLCRERMYLNPKYSVFAYLNFQGTVRRRSAFTGIGDVVSANGFRVLSEISHPPFGFVLALDGGAPDKRLVDISYFARYPYERLATLHMQLPVLPTHFWFPGDYRNLDDIKKQRESTEQEMQRLTQGEDPAQG